MIRHEHKQGASNHRCYNVLVLVVLQSMIVAQLSFADSISFSANSVVSSYESGNEKTTLEGKAKVRTSDLDISANRIEIIGSKQEILYARGQVSVIDRKRNMVIQGNIFNFDRKLELLLVQGSAMLEDFDNKVVIRSELFEYRMKTDLALINTGVRLYKDDIRAQAESASYDRKKSVLVLKGMPVVNKGADRYQADTIRIFTETDEIELLGAVEGTVKDKSSGGT
jgi:lipopolysaccharide export system protein LptA